MKISYNWLKELVKFDMPGGRPCECSNQSGLRNTY